MRDKDKHLMSANLIAMCGIAITWITADAATSGNQEKQRVDGKSLFRSRVGRIAE